MDWAPLSQICSWGIFINLFPLCKMHFTLMCIFLSHYLYVFFSIFVWDTNILDIRHNRDIWLVIVTGQDKDSRIKKENYFCAFNCASFLCFLSMCAILLFCIGPHIMQLVQSEVCSIALHPKILPDENKTLRKTPKMSSSMEHSQIVSPAGVVSHFCISVCSVMWLAKYLFAIYVSILSLSGVSPLRGWEKPVSFWALGQRCLLCQAGCGFSIQQIL